MEPLLADAFEQELHNNWGSLFDDGYDEDDDEYIPFDDGYDSDRLSDASDWDPVDIIEEDHAPPIHLERTASLHQRLGTSSKLERVLKILYYMESLDMNLPLFLDALSWGDDACISDPKVQYERTTLMVSEELPRILERWHRVPRASTARHHHVRPNGARKALEQFSVSCVAEIIDRELEETAPLFRSPADALSEEGLTAFNFAEVAEKLERSSGAPTLWSLLTGAMRRLHKASPRSQHESLSRRNPTFAAVMMFSQLQYMRSRNLTAWTKPLTVFLKSKGVSAKALDLLHALGISMSHSWSVRAFAGISAHAMEDLEKVIRFLAWWLTYDNVNFAFRVFEQRLQNQSHFDSGTSGSVFVKPNAPQPPPISSAALQEQRRMGRINPITLADIVELDAAAAPRIHRRIIHIVLQSLLDAPEFDLSTYAHRSHPALTPPAPVKPLPHGPEHVTKQYVLGTVHVDESSYDGTDDLITEWLRQLHYDSPEEHQRTGLERVFFWIGDQLTVDRLRGLANYRCEDLNGFDRLDWLVMVFGWFHLQMAFANSLHRQYFGTAAGQGLRKAFAHLQRKGLQNVQIKGTFHHHLHEGILHVTEAHLRTCWKEVTGVQSLADLRNLTPEELLAFAEEVVTQHASNDAIEDLEECMDGQHDDLLRQATMWNRDALYYLLLDGAMRQGDVGLMEDLLPHLFFRFSGGGNHKYAVEILELLQGLHREWTDEVKDFVRNNCWLINMKGGPEDFVAIDLVQEHTIKDVKVTYRPKGPNAGWDLMKARAPAIPVLRAVDEEIARQFRTTYRGTSHTTPSKEADIKHLIDLFTESKLHVYCPGRVVPKTSADHVKEFVSDGVTIAARNIIPKWLERRAVYDHATSQTWTSEDSTTAGANVPGATA
ncbi:hypothetical protein ONZ51_g5810 [Trametes cubensis]|uniref:DUF6589 domain-containing protein n=1 Tax=Trametes cubensis TaxID=1111947 RepID=A0AAD7TVQ0_9APHY|nr:hypothetical protein ONZ51_g5810 [Trametes cubensis]